MSRLTHNILGLMLILTAVGSIGQLMLKIGMGQVSNKAPSALGIVKIMLTEPLVFGGLLLYALNTILYLRVLQQYPLSLVYPMIAISYVLVTLLSWLFLSETISPLRLAGLLVIVAGVLLLAMSAKEKTPRISSASASAASMPPSDPAR